MPQFSPTLSNEAGTVVSLNRDAEIFYTQDGDFVFGNGYANIDTNGAGPGAFRFDLPVASNFTGKDAFLNGSGKTLSSVTGIADIPNNEITVYIQSTTNTNIDLFFSFSYKII